MGCQWAAPCLHWLPLYKVASREKGGPYENTCNQSPFQRENYRFHSLVWAEPYRASDDGRTQEGSRPQVVILNTRTVTAAVEAVDYQTRMATLKRSDRSTVTFRVSDNFHNLDKVKGGDTAKAVYFDSTAITVRKPNGSSSTPMRARGDPARAPTSPLYPTRRTRPRREAPAARHKRLLR